MAINKNFVIKNGAEINTKLLVADADTQRVGVGTTVAGYTLHVFGTNEQPGGIGASVVNVTGVTTTVLLNVGAAATFSNGPVFIGVGESTGTPLQPLQVGSATTTQGIYVSGDVGIGETFPGAKLEVVPESTRIAGLFTGTTSDDMVRITQLGSGNALVVEDEANTDATSFVISGLGSVGIGTNVPRYLLDIDGTKVAGEGLAIGQTAVYIRGDVKIIGDLSADDITLDQAVFTTINVTGFSTLGGTSATLLNVSGVSTAAGGFEASEGIDAARLNVTGITTLGFATAASLKVSGISTLGDATAASAVVSGFSTLGGASASLLSVSGVGTVSGGFEASQGLEAARLTVTGVSTLSGGVNAAQGVESARLTVTGVSTLTGGVNAAQGAELARLTVTGVSTLSGGVNAAQGVEAARLSVSGISTIGNFLVTPDAAGVGATVGAAVGVITYHGDGSNLTGVSIGIQSGGFLVGYGVTTLNFIGAGNTFNYDTTTNTVDISIQGGGGGFFVQDDVGISTASAVGIGTTTLDDSDLVGVGNSFQGLYIRNGMMIVDNSLDGNHYIGTNFNGMMAGPVTVNGTLTVDGNWVVV